MKTAPDARPAKPAIRWATVAALLVLTGCTPGVLEPRGPIGTAERQILIDSMIIMLCIVVPTIAATLAFAWWFRASNPRARRLPDFAYSGQIELVTWSVPILTITLLGGVTWIGSHELDPAKPLAVADGAKPLEVQVVSLDWKWLFIYPDQRVASVNDLVIPAGTPVHFQLTSASVMNSFFVPQLGSSIYTMNGMSADLNLQADKPGTFAGLSIHYSGDGFSDMYFQVRALDASGFDGWVAAARKDGPVLVDASYAELSKQSMKVKPYTYREADSGLFHKVVTLKIPPGPGPQGSGGGQAGQAAEGDGAKRPQTSQIDAATTNVGNR